MDRKLLACWLLRLVVAGKSQVEGTPLGVGVTESQAKAKLTELLKEFRAQSVGLDPEVIARCYPWRLSKPCQVVDYWVQPEDMHVISIVHHANAEDGRIDVFRAEQYEDLFERMDEALRLSVWDGIVDEHQDALFVLPPRLEPDKPLTLRRLEIDFLASLLKRTKELLLHRMPMRPGRGASSSRIEELSHVEWFGPLDALDVKTTVEQMIGQAKSDYAGYQAHLAARAANPPPSQQTETEETKWDGGWTCLHPRVSIGAQPEPTLAAALSLQTPDFMYVKREQLREVAGAPIRFTCHGFLLVVDPDLRLARRVMNHIVFLLGNRGLAVRSIGPHDFAGFAFDPRPDSWPGAFSTIGLISDPSRQTPTTEANGIFDWIQEKTTRHLTDAEFEAIARHGWQLASSRWAKEIEWYVDAEALAAQGRYSASLLTAWTGIERVTYGLLDEALAAAQVPQKLRDHCSRRQFSEALRLANDLSVKGIPTNADVQEQKPLRDGVAHRGAEATNEQASEARTLLSRLLQPLVQRELQGLLLPNEPAKI